ncbi:MAG: type II toxin-antitoxin system HicB family antitoxin [Anaerolineae bacterium]
MGHKPELEQADRKHLDRPKVVVEQDEDWYVATSIDLDIASQGRTMEEALSNLAEALDLFFESADDAEVEQRLRGTS